MVNRRTSTRQAATDPTRSSTISSTTPTTVSLPSSADSPYTSARQSSTTSSAKPTPRSSKAEEKGEYTRDATQSQQAHTTTTDAAMPLIQKSTLSRWIILALASGCFAALNGAFAKLTTTSLTSSLAASITHLFSPHASPDAFFPRLVNVALRAAFFGLNLISNGIMWALFTRALTAHPSATQVSLVNTSANFLLTAVLGWVVFGESLKGLWWAGAACLVVGNVIVGRGTGEGEKEGGGGDGTAGGSGEGAIRLGDDGDAGTGGLGASDGVLRGVMGVDGEEVREGESVPLVGGDVMDGDEEGIEPDGVHDELRR